MLAEFQEVWHGRLDLILMAKQGVELISSEVNPINSTPYPPGSKARKLEKTKTDKILRMIVIELA